MHAGDRNNLGWAFLRDHSAAEPNARNVPGFWVWAGDYSESDKPLPTHMGGFDGGMAWAAVDRNGVDAGFWAGPPVVSKSPAGTSTGGTWQLLRDVDTPDGRLESKNLARPSWALGAFPKGYTGQASAAIEESRQVDISHPDFQNALFAPQQHGPASTGTYIYDLTDESEPDPDRAFQLQQLVRVADLGSGLCGFGGLAPALQLGVEDLETKSGGLPFAEGRAIGLGSWLAGGPFTVGVGLCQHAQTGPDGHLSPLHLQTGALFLGAHDGPLDFRGQIDVGTGDEPGVWQRVHLDWDPEAVHQAGCQPGFGKWKWRVRLPHYVGEPPRQPPPGDEFPPGGQPPLQPPPPVTGGDPFPPSQPGNGNGLVFNPYPPQLVSDGSKPTYATSPFTQSAPGYTFKPQDPTTGAEAANDALVDWHTQSPIVAGLYAFGEQQQGEWVTESATAFSHAVGQGSVMLVPGDVDPYAVARGDDVTTNYPTHLALPTGLASLALGAVTTGGLVGSGFTISTDSSGNLDFNTVNAAGAVTATATLASGATSFGAGTGDVTGPGSSTDTGIAVWSGTGGDAISSTSVLVDGQNLVDVQGIAHQGTSGSPLSGSQTGPFLDTGGNGLASTSYMLDTAGTLTSIVHVDPSGAGAGQILAVNGSGNGFAVGADLDDLDDVDTSGVSDGDTLVYNSGTWGVGSGSVAELDDLSDVAITSVATGDYLRYNGSNYINTPEINATNDPGSIGVSSPSHFLGNDYTTTASRDSFVLELGATANTHVGSQGTALAFSNFGGTHCGAVIGVRTGSTTGHIAIQASTLTDLLSVKDSSSQQRVVLHGDGILAMEDTLTSGTYTPEGSGFGHMYWKNGILYVVPPGGSETVLAGTGSVQNDLNNAGNVVSGPSSDGETFVYSTGDSGFVAANLYAPPTDQDIVLDGTGVVCVDSTGAFKIGASGPTWTAGSGTPEGSVDQPRGSIYSDTASGNVYRKTTTSGTDTGWVAM